MTRSQVIETYFMEHRAKLLDIAAFLDRLDRAQPDSTSAREDFRIDALRRAIAMLDDQPNRARRIHESFSDMTEAPLDSAAGMKGAYGAVHP